MDESVQSPTLIFLSPYCCSVADLQFSSPVPASVLFMKLSLDAAPALVLLFERSKLPRSMCLPQ